MIHVNCGLHNSIILFFWDLKPHNLVHMYELHGVISQAMQFGKHVRTTWRHISSLAVWYTCTNYIASHLTPRNLVHMYELHGVTSEDDRDVQTPASRN